MSITQLQTRIALKYDSYENWIIPKTVDGYEAKRTAAEAAGTGPYLVLLPGELGICEIPSVNKDSNVAPTVLFKVGGAKYPEGHAKAGQYMVFKDLPWASAKAADVYGWAKSETVELVVDTAEGKETGRRLVFKTGNTENLSISLNDFVTEAELAVINENLGSRISALEGYFNAESDDSVQAQLEAINTSLDNITKDEGLIDTAKAEAVEAAKTYTDGRETEIKKAYEAYVDGFVGADGSITKRVVDLESATTALENEFETVGDADGRVVVLEKAKTDHENRLKTLEVFFEGADASSEESTLYDALDTLKEIQEFIGHDGDQAAGLIKEIAEIKSIVGGTDGTLTKRVEEAESEIDGLQALTLGFSDGETDGAIKTAIDAAAALGQQGIDDADAAAQAASAAQGAAEKAQDDVDELAGKVNDNATGLGKTYEIATAAAGDAAAVKNNYVKTDDQSNPTKLMFGDDIIIFNCGSASVNIA